MIILVNGSERGQYPHLVSNMHRLRATTFHDRLGWDVTVKNGQEIDEFDEENPLYLIAVDPTGTQVKGTVRLLPTTGRNMLRDVFPSLLPKNEIVESATIWECSRFAIDPSAEARKENMLISETTGELVAAACEVGLKAGLTEYVGVFDARFIRILKAAGVPPIIIGKPQQIGVCMTYVGLFEVSIQTLERIRAASGLEGSVLETESSRRYFAS